MSDMTKFESELVEALTCVGSMVGIMEIHDIDKLSASVVMDGAQRAGIDTAMFSIILATMDMAGILICKDDEAEDGGVAICRGREWEKGHLAVRRFLLRLVHGGVAGDGPAPREPGYTDSDGNFESLAETAREIDVINAMLKLSTTPGSA